MAPFDDFKDLLMVGSLVADWADISEFHLNVETFLS
jgi:hypothetical protein